MASKFIICALALLIQTVSAQLLGSMFGSGMFGNNLAAVETAAVVAANTVPCPANALAFEAPLAPITGCGFGLTLAELAANGGGFAVSSSSPISPNGVKVQSENLMFEGPLAVTGTMPFLGSVGLEGPLPAAGQGAVAYGCGNGNVGILTEELPGVYTAATTFPGPTGPNPAMGGYNGMGCRGPYGPMY